MTLSTRDFMESIYSGLEGHIVVARTDGKGAWNRESWYTIPEQLDDAISDAEWGINESVGYSPFVYPTPQRTATDDAVTQLIAVDADYHDPSEFKATPSFVIETSPKSFHLGWLLTEPVSQSEAVAIGRSIRDEHHLEASALIRTKLLRLPETTNLDSSKVLGKAAYRVKGSVTGEMYLASELATSYPPIAEPSVSSAIPEDFPATLPKRFEVENKIAFTERINFLLNWRQDDQTGQERHKRSERIHELCNLLFEAGLTPPEVVVLAWDADPVQEHYVAKKDRGIHEFWRYDVVPAYRKHLLKAAVSDPSNYEPEEITVDVERTLQLVTPDELALLPPSFVDQWVSACKAALDERTPVEYGIINGYVLMAAALGDMVHTYSPNAGDPIRCNIFTLNLGPTTTGKTKSLRFFTKTLQVIEDSIGYNIYIGSEGTPEGIVKALKDYDARSAMIARDEVAGMFEDWIKKNHASNTSETYLQLYNNWVPTRLLASKDAGNPERVDLAGFYAYFMGTPEKTLEVMTEDFYFSGFMQRFIPVLAEKADESDEEFLRHKTTFNKGKAEAYKTLPHEVAEELLAIRTWLDVDHAITLTEDAAQRWATVSLALKKYVHGHRYEQQLESVMERMSESILKLALAVAAWSRSEVIEEAHIVSVARHAEQWAANVLKMVDLISASQHSRLVDETAAWIISRGGKVTPPQFHRFLSKYEPRARGDVLISLRETGRVKSHRDDKEREYILSTEV